jgi:hypothetical protein
MDHIKPKKILNDFQPDDEEQDFAKNGGILMLKTDHLKSKPNPKLVQLENIEKIKIMRESSRLDALMAAKNDYEMINRNMAAELGEDIRERAT